MSQSKIYVGNLSYNTTEDELRDYFAQFGNIEDIKLIIDFNTGRSKGFGFITYGSAQDCESAVAAANGVDMSGRKIRVNIAREDDRGGRSGGGAGAPRRPFNRDRGGRSDHNRE